MRSVSLCALMLRDGVCFWGSLPMCFLIGSMHLRTRQPHTVVRFLCLPALSYIPSGASAFAFSIHAYTLQAREQEGSLQDLLVDAERRHAMRWRTRVEIICGVLRALNYLHTPTAMKPQIVHR
jgi:hypothetical protein